MANSDFTKVIQATVFLADIHDFSAVNEVYKEFFLEDFPARAAVQVGPRLGKGVWQVAALPRAGALVEIKAVAVSGPLETTYVTEE